MAILDYLVERGPTCIKTPGVTPRLEPLQVPLSIAVGTARPRLEVVECLLRHYPGAANEHDHLGLYLLHRFCANKTTWATRALIECLAAANPPVLKVEDIYGRTPLDIAIELGITTDAIATLIDLDPQSLTRAKKT